MDRNQMLHKIKNNSEQTWDVIVIGGGATGLGVALDSATRGFSTLLLEQSDFSKGTSSRSTKLVHGGVRYLAQGDVSLVLEALHERGLLRQNAPHLVKNQKFIIPNYSWWSGPFFTLGMKVYDMMSGKLGLGKSERITKEETLKAIPNLSETDLIGGVIYYDGQFDDSRLAVNLAQTIIENGGIAINYFKVTGLIKDEEGIVCGVEARDMESGEEFNIKGRSVVNATGVFVDDILKMNDPTAKKIVKPSQGVHIILDKSFLQGDAAIMIPKTSDGRVLFAVPWHDKVILGTTDTPLEEPGLEPRALEEEIEFILKTAEKYLEKDPKREDVLSIFAGLRPLAAPEDSEGKETKEISRSHKLIVSLSGLITITGGKWTTYRKMAEDTIDKAIIIGGLKEKKCVTEQMPIHGYVKQVNYNDHMYIYGSDRMKLLKLIEKEPKMKEKLHERLPFLKGEVLWAVRYEMARTVEDVLARRVRALFLDARASMDMAEDVARIIAKELKYNKRWIKRQVQEYKELAQGYILE